MSKKYEMKICKCGRIHMIDTNKLNKALKSNKNLILICAGCGTAILIKVDIEAEWKESNNNCYMMCLSDFSPYENKHITSVDFNFTEPHKAIEEIIYSHGIKVPMESGQYATDYYNGKFSDRWYPDFYKIQHESITVNEIMDFIDEYNHNRTTVDMNRFIYSTPDDMLTEISHYPIKSFNWKGTKWEKNEIFDTLHD